MAGFAASDYTSATLLESISSVLVRRNGPASSRMPNDARPDSRIGQEHGIEREDILPPSAENASTAAQGYSKLESERPTGNFWGIG